MTIPNYDYIIASDIGTQAIVVHFNNYCGQIVPKGGNYTNQVIGKREVGG